MIIECRSFRGASGLLLPRTMATLRCGSPAPEDRHLRPLITADDGRLPVGRIGGSHIRFRHAESGADPPARSGFGHRSFRPSVPPLSNTSMLPISEAAQLNTSGAMTLDP